MKYIRSLKMVPSDEELELGLNLIHKIALKHLIPVSNCFHRRKTFVAMQVPLQSQMTSSEFRLDPLSWLDDLSRVQEIHSLNPEGTSTSKAQYPQALLTCFSVERSKVCKEVFSDCSVT